MDKTKLKYHCKECKSLINSRTAIYGTGICHKCATEIIIDKKLLKQKYIDELKSITKIADEFNCNYVTIYNRLLKFKIPLRSKRESHLGKKRPEHSKLMTGKGNPLFGKKRSKKVRENISKTRKRRIKEGKIISRKGIKNPEWGKKLKKDWQNSEFRQKRLESAFKKMCLKPNKIEQVLNKILNYLLPKQYKYVGDGKIVLDGFNPDFIDEKNKNIIELYGDYWHNKPEWKERDIRRAISYKRLGYKFLVIWEHEVYDIDILVSKLIKFHK